MLGRISGGVSPVAGEKEKHMFCIGSGQIVLYLDSYIFGPFFLRQVAPF